MDNLNVWIQAAIIFISQLVFIYYRTSNVTAQIEKNRFKLFWTGAIVHVTWLLSTAIGVNAILHNNWLLIVFSLFGGLLGADLSFTKKLKLVKNDL
jgi:hypothetical protein